MSEMTTHSENLKRNTDEARRYSIPTLCGSLR
jgi:hypothetical protein